MSQLRLYTPIIIVPLQGAGGRGVYTDGSVWAAEPQTSGGINYSPAGHFWSYGRKSSSNYDPPSAPFYLVANGEFMFMNSRLYVYTAEGYHTLRLWSDLNKNDQFCNDLGELYPTNLFLT